MFNLEGLAEYRAFVTAEMILPEFSDPRVDATKGCGVPALYDEAGNDFHAINWQMRCHAVANEK